MVRAIPRGDVWLVSLDPTVGSEIRKTRPCVVISPPEMHNNIRTVLIAPMTSGSKPAPGRVHVHFNDKDGFILLEQIRAVDKSRLIKNLGIITPAELSRTLHTLQDIFTK